MWQDWLTFILGLWVFISSFIESAYTSAVHNIIFGILIAIFALWAAFKKPIEWINFILGLWFFISGFFLFNMWNNLIVGIVVAIIALISGVSKKGE